MTIKKPSENRYFDHLLKNGGKEWWIEFTTGTRSTRDLRARMLSLAMNLHHSTEEMFNKYAVLIIINPEMTKRSIEEEWLLFLSVIDGKYRDHLKLLIWLDGEINNVASYEPSYGNEELPLKDIRALITKEFKPKRGCLPQADFYHIITTLLIKNFFEGNSYLKNKDLQDEAQCSYPTLQRILRKLDTWLERDSSRSLRLKQFPEDIWWKLLSNAPVARHTVRFQDVSGQPRSIESLIKQFQKREIQDVAIGGVTAAVFHYPMLDIVGSPRLDLIVHVAPTNRRPKNHAISAEKLASIIDPGLEETNDPTTPVRLAIHYLRRKNSDFVKDESNGYWLADPMECLYDLHDARLTPQAEQLLNHLKQQRS